MQEMRMQTLKELKAEEKFLFDTYRNHKPNKAKSAHLRRMADVIDQIEFIEQQNSKTKHK